MGADQVSKNIRMYRGNGVKTTVLSVNMEFIPERALLRFDQERGQGSGKVIKIAPAESMSGISITVTNRKPEASSPKPALQMRLGVPQGEKEKGEVRQDARDARVARELQEARDHQDARASNPPQPLKLVVKKTRASERFERSARWTSRLGRRRRRCRSRAVVRVPRVAVMTMTESQ